MRKRSLFAALTLPLGLAAASPAQAATLDLNCTVTPTTGAATTMALAFPAGALGPATIPAGTTGGIDLAMSFDSAAIPTATPVVARNLTAIVSLPAGAEPRQAGSTLSVLPQAGAAAVQVSAAQRSFALRTAGPIAPNSGVFALSAHLAIAVPTATAADTVISPTLSAVNFDLTTPAGGAVAKVACSTPANELLAMKAAAAAVKTTTTVPTTAATTVTTLLPPAPKPLGSLNEYGSAKEPASSVTPGGLGALNGRVFLDTDGTGTKNINEPGLSGVPVVLRDQAGKVVYRDNTGAGGAYGFVNIAAGRYYVDVEVPVGYMGDDYGQANAVELVRGARLTGPDLPLRVAPGATTTAAASTAAASTAATSAAATASVSAAESVSATAMIPATKPAFTGTGRGWIAGAGLLASLGALLAFAWARREAQIGR